MYYVVCLFLGNSPGMTHFEAVSKVPLLPECREKQTKKGDCSVDITEENLNLNLKQKQNQEPAGKYISIVRNANQKQKQNQVAAGKYISRVSSALVKTNSDAYKPKLISIGPYHMEDPGLENGVKQGFQKSLFEKIDGFKEHSTKRLMELKDKARSWYAEDTQHMNDAQFVDMLLLDGCFILEFLEKYYEDEVTDDFMKVKGNLVPTLIDMILFENQIPFFVLFELFKLKHHHLHPRNDNEKEDNDAVLLQKLIVLVRKCIGTQVPKLPPGNVAAHKYKPVRNGLPKHLVEVVHDLCIPRNPKCGRLRDGDDSGGIIEQINTATELEKDGVGFKKIGKVYEKYFEKEEASAKNCNPKSGRLRNNDDSGGIIEQINTATDQLEEDGVGFKKIGKVYEKYFGKKEARAKNFNAKDCTTMFDIDFSNGILKIPSFRIDDDTERLLRNMIAYEQHSTDTPVWFSDFASFMDQLIDSTEDVNLLRRRGIIVNCMAKNEMITDIFKDLCQDVITYNTFSGVIRKINLHGENAWNVLLGKLKHDLSYSPWKLISAVVGGLVASISTAYALRNLLR
ncbi:PREDICTED: putative UPF0481 protein At3g02645 isoform X2 [Ipomoea nil]|uniref:putative UPF0481 protein At3g02645 isoform X2 n=1 Tax=Ipomoea nil TaxID=35883 RepID=UPI000901588D|nr:PREDICTED: putative UPF0481 protein At3g02645 isoform X2 [Ipomoea nil]